MQNIDVVKCNIYDGIKINSQYIHSKLAFRGTLKQAEWRKLDTLIARAQVGPGQTLLDIGFGVGGLTIHASKNMVVKLLASLSL